jgi:MFS family permease
MTVASHALDSPGVMSRFWHRDLRSYPETLPRYYYLGIVVVTTVILYYQLYISGSVATQVLTTFHMSFGYYVGALVIANAIGAFTSLAAGLSDRVGRANLVVYGTIITSLIALVAVPNVHSKVGYSITLIATALVEGIILVATPALVRDFSPQVGRASAMGFWTMGPVLGSLVATEVSSHTLDNYASWRAQFVIAGIAGLVVSFIALLSLRELSARLRDQVMVSSKEQAAIESLARGVNVEEATRRPFAQMLKPDIIAPAFAIALFLVLYYTAVAFFPIYLQTALGFTASQANGLLNWYWGANAIALLVVGAFSDRLAVRKPFMLVGAVGSVAVTFALYQQANHHNPPYAAVALLLAFVGIYQGTAFAPWMAAFTETVERRNPALVATGLAVWGWILRAVVAIAFLVLPHIVTSVTPLVDKGPTVQTILERDALVVAEQQAHPEIFTELQKYPPNHIPDSVTKHAIETVGVGALLQVSDPNVQKDLQYLQTHAAEVQKAQKDAPKQWRHWFLVCLIGQILFIPLILLMGGFWSPRRARDDLERRDAAIRAAAAHTAPVGS